MRETYRSGLGDINGPNWPVVIGESENIPPVSILHEQRLEETPIASSRSLGEGREPFLGDGGNVMVDIGRRLVSLGMGREVGGVGYRSFKNHVEQMKVCEWVTELEISGELE
jgi:hypothetical protein